MKSSDFKGWRGIFLFTFIQTLKSKAYRITLLILAIIVCTSLPIYGYITKGSVEETLTSTSISTAYVINDTALGACDFSEIKEHEVFQMVEFVAKESSEYESLLVQMEENNENAVLIHITINDWGNLGIELLKAEGSDLSSNEVWAFSDVVLMCFEQQRGALLQLTAEQMELLNTSVIIDYSDYIETDEENFQDITPISHMEYMIVYGLMFIVLMVSVFSGSHIATRIITDKSSKVVEYLLTSVKPMAILLGNILAMLAVVLIQIMVMIVLFFVSGKITEHITGNTTTDLLGQFISLESLSNFGVWNLLLCLVVVLLGILIYGILAGLTGATVSKIEEANDGLVLFTIAALIGFYVGMGAVTAMVSSGVNGFVYFAMVFPLSSAFLLPGAVLIGEVGIAVTLLAIVVQVIVALCLLWFTSSVYETLILHNGNKVKLKQLLGMAKLSKGGRTHEK